MNQSYSREFNLSSIQSFNVSFNKSFINQFSRQFKKTQFGQSSSDPFQQNQEQSQYKQSQLKGKSSEQESSECYFVGKPIDELLKENSIFLNSDQLHIQQSVVPNVLKKGNVSWQNDKSWIKEGIQIPQFQAVMSCDSFQSVDEKDNNGFILVNEISCFDFVSVEIFSDSFSQSSFNTSENLTSQLHDSIIKPDLFNVESKLQRSHTINQSQIDNSYRSIISAKKDHAFTFSMPGNSQLITEDSNSYESSGLFPKILNENDLMELYSFSQETNSKPNMQLNASNQLKDQNGLESSQQLTIQNKLKFVQGYLDALNKYLILMPAAPQEIKSLRKNAGKIWFSFTKFFSNVIEIFDLSNLSKLPNQTRKWLTTSPIQFLFSLLPKCIKTPDKLSKTSQVIRKNILQAFSIFNNPQGRIDSKQLQKYKQKLGQQFPQLMKEIHELSKQKFYQYCKIMRLFVLRAIQNISKLYIQNSQTNSIEDSQKQTIPILSELEIIAKRFELQGYLGKKISISLNSNQLSFLQNEMKNVIQSGEEPWLYTINNLLS